MSPTKTKTQFFVGIYKIFSFMGKNFETYIICKTELTMSTTVTTEILQQTWQETEYSLDVCSIISSKHTAVFYDMYENFMS
jgi:hypothetical protein